MSLHLTARQRAMLAEMGVRLWLPRGQVPVAPAPEPPRPAPVQQPVPAARASAAAVPAERAERAVAQR